jgi:hypothetical protein
MMSIERIRVDLYDGSLNDNIETIQQRKLTYVNKVRGCSPTPATSVMGRKRTLVSSFPIWVEAGLICRKPPATFKLQRADADGRQAGLLWWRGVSAKLGALTQLPSLTRRRLLECDLPIDWSLQRRILGFPPKREQPYRNPIPINETESTRATSDEQYLPAYFANRTAVEA